MDRSKRRDAIRDYKERKTQPGVYAIRCASTGEIWVGGSKNIDAQQNSAWFSLRAGGHPNRALQAAWTAHGPDGVGFEVVERIEPGEMTPQGLADHLKDRERHWLSTLGAKKAVG
jgi:hypothetical protein